MRGVGAVRDTMWDDQTGSLTGSPLTYPISSDKGGASLLLSREIAYTEAFLKQVKVRDPFNSEEIIFRLFQQTILYNQSCRETPELECSD